jgi:hypothetical protein
VKGDPFFINQRERLVALAARCALPAIYSLAVFVEVGGLMSYGGTLLDSYQQEGIYAGKILKGAKPADLPIQQSTRFELVIRLLRRSALPGRPRCWSGPTRLSNDDPAMTAMGQLQTSQNASNRLKC